VAHTTSYVRWRFNLVIQVKSVRQKSYQEVKRLERVENIIVSEREIMRTTPAYPWTTHIRVELIRQRRSPILDQLEYVLSKRCFVRLFRVCLHVVYLTARLAISCSAMRQTASCLDTIGS
jgi:hypothetical protein